MKIQSIATLKIKTNELKKETKMKTLLATIITISALFAHAEEIKITKATKKILPTHMIMQFSEIDWWKIKKENAQNKKINFDSVVMQCDDGYYEKTEITSVGTIGKDLKVINKGCEFIGYWTDDFRTVLQFGWPKDGDQCEIEVEKIDEETDGSKTIKKFWYEIHGSC